MLRLLKCTFIVEKDSTMDQRLTGFYYGSRPSLLKQVNQGIADNGHEVKEYFFPVWWEHYIGKHILKCQ